MDDHSDVPGDGEQLDSRSDHSDYDEADGRHSSAADEHEVDERYELDAGHSTESPGGHSEGNGHDGHGEGEMHEGYE